MGNLKRPRDAAHAPDNSGSVKRPERINVRCTTEECGRMYAAIDTARQFRKAYNPASTDLDAADLIHGVIIPVFEKVVRAYLCGSAAERSLVSVYLEERIRKDDYLSKRRMFSQQVFDFQ